MVTVRKYPVVAVELVDAIVTPIPPMVEVEVLVVVDEVLVVVLVEELIVEEVDVVDEIAHDVQF